MTSNDCREAFEKWYLQHVGLKQGDYEVNFECPQIQWDLKVFAAAVLVAASDGSISEQEKEAAFKAISAHESLRGFKQSTIRAHFDSDVNLINSDRQLAEAVLYDKVKAISEIVARIRVIGVASQIANADGELSTKEQAVIDKIRRITG